MMQDGRPAYFLGEIVSRLGGELVGPSRVQITKVAPLHKAQPGHISFFTQGKYREQLRQTSASAVILGEKERDASDLPRIVSNNPYAYFAKVSQLLNPTPTVVPGIHPSAVIDPSAKISPTAHIGPLVCIGKNVQIGENTILHSGCQLGDNVSVGDSGLFYPQVTVYKDCMIGHRAIVHSGVVIGSDGFGLAMEDGCWLKIPQIGKVLIGDDVEIGANTTIDRGAMDDTVIENGVKLDNQIQIAHNVRIGAHTAMAGCSAVAGSTIVGHHCTIGGAASILGHLEIADYSNISAASLITKSVRQPGTYTSGMPFSEHRTWLRNAAHLRHLDQMAKRIHELEQKLNNPERGDFE
ncbi:MAG: UDP-3-O-(3-hydroxymyristoyl)glucosamine N-acyltransferase [Burkholderiales bacterium]